MTTAPTWLGPIRQTAFVVADIEKSAREWAEVQDIGLNGLNHLAQFANVGMDGEGDAACPPSNGDHDLSHRLK